MTTRKSCWYVFLIVRGEGSELGVVLKSSTPCPQQSTSSLESRSKESMGLRGLFRAINPFKCVTTSTVSTMNLECRSVERNVESTAVTTRV